MLVVLSARNAIALGASVYVGGFAASGDVAYFATQTSMCRTDGTPDGTRCFEIAENYGGWHAVVLNGKAYSVYAPPFGGTFTLYEFDGENPPRAFGLIPRNNLFPVLASNGRSLFYLTEHLDGVRVYRTDGTAAGTALVQALRTRRAEIAGGAGDSILLRVEDSATWKPRFQNELWATDGTSERTSMLHPAPFTSIAARVGATALFVSDRQLWRTDGTQTGTFAIAERGILPGPISVREPFAYFARGKDVWQTDGTHATVIRTLDFSPVAVGMAGGRLIAINELQSESVIWSAEADAAPVAIARAPRTGTGTGSGIVHAGPLAYFIVRSGGGRSQLWRTDGTADGTFSLGDFASVQALTPFGSNGKVVFLADDGVHGTEPWSSDGTRERTTMLANLAPEGVVRGTITDATTGDPIPNAEIIADQTTFRSGADGRYTIEGAIHSVTLRAQTFWHLPEQRTVTVNAHEEVSVDFALTRGARINGRVTSPAGAPLARMQVELVPGGREADAIRLATDDDGRYHSPVLSTATTWTVRSRPSHGWNAAARADLRIVPGAVYVVDLAMTPYGRVQLRMIDGVTQGPLRTDRFGSVFVFRTNDDGSGAPSPMTYALVHGSAVTFDLPDGEYQFASDSAVYANRWLDGLSCGNEYCGTKRYANRGRRIRVTGGTATVADFQVQPRGGSVRGVIVDAGTDLRLSDMMITVTDSTGAFWSRVYDDNGNFESEPVFPDGTVKIVVSALQPGYLTETVFLEMRSGENPRPEVKIRMTRGGTLVGRIVDRAGKGLAAANVTVAGRGEQTDADGYYSVRGLATGTYEVLVRRFGYEDVRAEGVALTNGKKTTLDLTMRRE